jgi:hypothetical protein
MRGVRGEGRRSATRRSRSNRAWSSSYCRAHAIAASSAVTTRRRRRRGLPIRAPSRPLHDRQAARRFAGTKNSSSRSVSASSSAGTMWSALVAGFGHPGVNSQRPPARATTQRAVRFHRAVRYSAAYARCAGTLETVTGKAATVLAMGDEPAIDLRPAAVKLMLEAQELVDLLQHPRTRHRARRAARQVADRARAVADELDRTEPAGPGLV